MINDKRVVVIRPAYNAGKKTSFQFQLPERPVKEALAPVFEHRR